MRKLDPTPLITRKLLLVVSVTGDRSKRQFGSGTAKGLQGGVHPSDERLEDGPNCLDGRVVYGLPCQRCVCYCVVPYRLQQEDELLAGVCRVSLLDHQSAHLVELTERPVTFAGITEQGRGVSNALLQEFQQVVVHGVSRHGVSSEQGVSRQALRNQRDATASELQEQRRRFRDDASLGAQVVSKTPEQRSAILRVVKVPRNNQARPADVDQGSDLRRLLRNAAVLSPLRICGEGLKKALCREPFEHSPVGVTLAD